MERWDFDCQVCGLNIGNYAYVDEYWYVCPWVTGWLDIKPDLEGLTYYEHTIYGRGWGRLGYTLCEKCAEKKEYKCPKCGAPLIKIHVDQHPGGHWGIKGDPVPKREPAPMV